MKKVEKGPWGEAIRYWLQQPNAQGEVWTQVELARAARLRRNTISRAFRGFHVTTRVLEEIAKALQLPLEDILVLPARRRAMDERWRRAEANTYRQMRLEEEDEQRREERDRRHPPSSAPGVVNDAARPPSVDRAMDRLVEHADQSEGFVPRRAVGPKRRLRRPRKRKKPKKPPTDEAA